ncbi:MAG: thiamine kinase-like enzyme [Lentimonas sp.]|jgi:thiamine kinase-like enzyme
MASPIFYTLTQSDQKRAHLLKTLHRFKLLKRQLIGEGQRTIPRAQRVPFQLEQHVRRKAADLSIRRAVMAVHRLIQSTRQRIHVTHGAAVTQVRLDLRPQLRRQVVVARDV